MPRIDTRKMTLEEAIAQADEYARCKLRIIAETAKTDARIAEHKARLVGKTAADAARMAELEPRIMAFLLSRKDELCAKRKKTIDTTAAKLGFRKCTDTDIQDEDAVIQFARDNGYTELYQETAAKVIKTAVRKRIERVGEEIPGAQVRTDYEPFVQPQKTLVDQAKRGEQ